MTIFVDKPKKYSKEEIKPAARRYGQQWSHLWTDGDLSELHAFARKLRLSPSWFQDRALLSHYDLTPSKFALACREGAQVVDLVDWLDQRKRTMQKIRAADGDDYDPDCPACLRGLPHSDAEHQDHPRRSRAADE